MKLLDQVREILLNRHDGDVGPCGQMPVGVGPNADARPRAAGENARSRNKGVVLFPEIG